MLLFLQRTAMGSIARPICYATTLCAMCAALVMLFVGFVEYLQIGRWDTPSLLEIGYESHLIKARWFLAHQWSWWIHDTLERVPVALFLIGVAPLFWWVGNRLDRH